MDKISIEDFQIWLSEIQEKVADNEHFRITGIFMQALKVQAVPKALEPQPSAINGLGVICCPKCGTAIAKDWEGKR